MGGGDGSKKIAATSEMENLSLGISANKKVSIDFLQRFMSNNNEYEGVKEEDQEIELNLGLSLGGRFGVDRSSKNLVRSSSIASVLPVIRDDNDAVAPPPPAAYTGLMRSSSLPVETEEEWRKRKESQTLRRMEAKRRRSEKQRTTKGGGSSGGGVSLNLDERREIEVNLRVRLEREKYFTAVKRLGLTVGSKIGSMDSKGGSSSSVSELENKTLPGSSGELSPASIQSLRGRNQDIGSFANRARENIRWPTVSEMESESKQPDTSRNRHTDVVRGSAQNMPCVFTKGDGPNGRRVDGILYRYGKGEEVRIMCVCHGDFHSPVEFIKHAGGTDVEHPLKHIVVNPNGSSFL